MFHAHVFFEVAELGKLTPAVLNFTLELFVLDLLEVSILRMWVVSRKEQTL